MLDKVSVGGDEDTNTPLLLHDLIIRATLSVALLDMIELLASLGGAAVADVSVQVLCNSSIFCILYARSLPDDSTRAFTNWGDRSERNLLETLAQGPAQKRMSSFVSLEMSTFDLSLNFGLSNYKSVDVDK